MGHQEIHDLTTFMSFIDLLLVAYDGGGRRRMDFEI